MSQNKPGDQTAALASHQSDGQAAQAPFLVILTQLYMALAFIFFPPFADGSGLLSNNKVLLMLPDTGQLLVTDLTDEQCQQFNIQVHGDAASISAAAASVTGVDGINVAASHNPSGGVATSEVATLGVTTSGAQVSVHIFPLSEEVVLPIKN